MPRRTRALLEAWAGVAGVIVGVVTVIVAVVTLYIAHKDARELHDAVATGKVTESATDTVLLDNRPYAPPTGSLRVQFWTPSVRTKESSDAKTWEKIANDDKINEFGRQLIEQGIALGYRHYEVSGYGKGGAKMGTWWVATGPFKFVEFLKLYRQIWNQGYDDIYMEIAPAAGGHSSR